MTRCENCFYFVSGMHGKGECKRFPASYKWTSRTGGSGFSGPDVDEGSFCGEFKGHGFIKWSEEVFKTMIKLKDRILIEGKGYKIDAVTTGYYRNSCKIKFFVLNLFLRLLFKLETPVTSLIVNNSEYECGISGR